MLFFCVYLLIGAAIGLLSGLLGIGGGVLAIPCLAKLFVQQGMPSALYMHLAEGTSLTVIFVSSFASMLSHKRRRVIVWPIYQRLAPGILLGTLLGTLLAHHLSSYQLRSLFSLFVFAFGLYMLLHKSTTTQRSLPSWWPLLVLSTVIGIAAGLLGVGGGLLLIPMLTFYHVPIRQALAISTSCVCSIAAFGTVLFMILGSQQLGLPAWSTGYVYWPALLGLALPSPLFAYWGVALSHRLPGALLKRLFAVLLLIVGFYMAWGFRT